MTEIDKIQPLMNRDAEAKLIGGVMRDNEAYADIAAVIQAEDFQSNAYQEIWRVISELVQKSGAAIPLEIHKRLEAKGVSRDCGGAELLVTLWQEAWTSHSLVAYAEEVRRLSILRAISRLAENLQKRCHDPGADPSDVLAEVEAAIFDMAHKRVVSKAADWPTSLDEAFEIINRRSGKSKDGEFDEGLKTGWPLVDELTGGLHKKELVILAARPSVGKTLVAMCIADHIASSGGKILVASLEQAKNELVQRILSKRAKINSAKFRHGNLTPMDMGDLKAAANGTIDHRIWINDGSLQTITAITSEARRLKARYGLDLVIVDYLQLMPTEGYRTSTRSEEVGRLTRGLKRLAKDLDIVVLCLAQLNRGSENRTDKRPRLADLRDSGEIEQDADTVFMLHKPEEKNAARELDLLDWLIEKQRNGPCGDVALVHQKSCFQVYELQKPNSFLP